MPEITLDYEPQARQQLLHSTIARQIFYGGAAGGGKSHSLRWDAIQFCLNNPGLEAFLFRRTLGELQDNHIRRIKLELPNQAGKFSDSRNTFEFANGSVLRFCYCEREDDVRRYQGAEFHWLGIDEASHFTEFQIAYLRGRVRIGGFRPVEHWLLPRIVFGSNPGGPGHSFLKSTFIEGRQPEVMFYDYSMADESDPSDKGWLSIFIPAKIADNRFLPSNYAGQFKSLPPELARALAEGDWDAVVGQALHTLSREQHQIRPFNPPRHWTRFMSMDWGTASPFSIGWYAVSEGALLAAKDGWDEKWLPTGAIVKFREWYGWNGRANKGCRMESPAVARGIIEREDAPQDYRVADTEIWAQKDGPCVAERMGNIDERLNFRRAIKDRRRNYEEFLARLAGSPEYGADGEPGDYPMFYITSNCIHFWRTVPILTLDNLDPDKGPDTKLEDHCYDETAYALRSRPYVSTKEDRYMAEHYDEIKEARGKVVGRYAT
ncbi:MAG: phage terminase large subunit [Candidatus Brocadiales bacterium]|nr:phage terminase large subunit [Candidatus Bathyanammoxibius sp.]